MTVAALIAIVVAEKATATVRDNWVRITIVVILALMVGGLLLTASRP